MSKDQHKCPLESGTVHVTFDQIDRDADLILEDVRADRGILAFLLVLSLIANAVLVTVVVT